jgi:hypothetical protein
MPPPCSRQDFSPEDGEARREASTPVKRMYEVVARLSRVQTSSRSCPAAGSGTKISKAEAWTPTVRRHATPRPGKRDEAIACSAPYWVNLFHTQFIRNQ